MGLAFGGAVAGQGHGAALRQAQLVHQRIGEPGRLVGDHAPGDPLLFQGGQQVLETVEQLAVHGDGIAVELQKALPQRLDFLLAAVLGEGQPRQRQTALRDLRAYGLQRQCRQAFLDPQRIQRRGHVGGGIKQRAVEIEQQGEIGHGPAYRSVQVIR